MKLTLTLTRGDDPQGTPIESRSFDDRGLTLGRGSENDWVLDDPNRHLSKSHCAIEFESGEFLVTDTSTNGVFINQAAERLGRGNTMGLRDGDQIGLGEHLVQVQIAASDAAAAVGPSDDELDDVFGDAFEPAAKSAGLADSDDLFAEESDLPGHAQGPDDIFAGFEEPGVGESSSDLIGDIERAAGEASVGADLIPDDFDILGDDGQDEAFGVETEADHVPSEGEYFRPPDVLPDDDTGGGLIPDNWDADLDKPLPEATMPPPVRSEPAARPQPAARLEPAPTPQPEPRPTGPVSSAATGDALAAFLAGAGLDPASLSTADAETLMQVVGEAFREMVKGLQETLLARSEIKSEFRLERTMIRPKENNPLKFSPSVDEAMAAMLQDGHGGAYLTPVAAVREGFNDLQAHQVAVMAGMQVALSALLKRFDPNALEKRLKSQSVLESILPAARKAKYWELYEELYKEIAREAEDDFQGLFGREFATAYERQVKKL